MAKKSDAEKLFEKAAETIRAESVRVGVSCYIESDFRGKFPRLTVRVVDAKDGVGVVGEQRYPKNVR